MSGNKKPDLKKEDLIKSPRAIKKHYENSPINDDDFRLSPKGLTPEERAEALDKFQDYEKQQKQFFLGYQANQKLNYSKTLSQYLDYHINNIGDPFVEGNFTVNSKMMERAVLDYFAVLWNAKLRPDPKATLSYEDWKDSYWGYVVSMGCTEGNVYGLWNARDYLGGKILLVDPKAEVAARKASLDGVAAPINQHGMYYQAKASKENPNAYSPVAFYSQDTHYSIVKAMRVLSIHTFNEIGSGKFECPLKYPEDYPPNYSKHYLDDNGWPLEVPSNEDGSIHIPALVKLIDFFSGPGMGYPVMVCFNYGTTFKGAYDNVKEAVDKLVPILKKNNMYTRKVYYDDKKFDIRNGFWFHVDGALGAAYMPFIEMAVQSKQLAMPLDFSFPIFDFRIKEIHSIAMSGHKWIGAPWPCGIYMTKVKYQLQPPDDPMYIGSPDTTFAGSRNGFSSMILWDYLSRNSYKDLIKKAIQTEEMAAYAKTQLEKLQEKLKTDLWIEYTPLSLTIRFKKANPGIVFKYSLSGEDLYVNDQKRSYSHIFMMEHVDRKKIDSLIEDLSKPGAFPPQSPKKQVQSFEYEPQHAKRILYVPKTGRGFK
ncbi:MAG: pyridoxal-dependent decarboxylase [Clostridia bacterium]|nr:pyridoxal-dependent decarboxylase [Clostridia bacterium]